jgi:prepilin-type N-terminal cleavage/methylation domain-containing protein
MKKSCAFTLIEVLIVLAIIGSMLAFSVVGIAKFRNSLEYANSVNQVLSDIKLTQQLADMSCKTCKIEFKAGKNAYIITEGAQLYRSCIASGKIQFYGKSYFSFVPSGYTEVGGSGTLFLGGSTKVKKIVVSSKGRIRIE